MVFSPATSNVFLESLGIYKGFPNWGKDDFGQNAHFSGCLGRTEPIGSVVGVDVEGEQPPDIPDILTLPQFIASNFSAGLLLC